MAITVSRESIIPGKLTQVTVTAAAADTGTINLKEYLGTRLLPNSGVICRIFCQYTTGNSTGSTVAIEQDGGIALDLGSTNVFVTLDERSSTNSFPFGTNDDLDLVLTTVAQPIVVKLYCQHRPTLGV